MDKSTLACFNYLKKELEKKFREENIYNTLEITQWKQKEINLFQEMIEREVNDRISEKWFYTHIKNQNNTKLPRIDTLNLLCRFVGYINWDEFVAKNKEKLPYNTNKQRFNRLLIAKYKKVLIGLLLVLLLFSVVVFSNTSLFARQKYTFCFVNSDTGDPLLNKIVEVYILHNNQSAELIKNDTASCFEYQTNQAEINFVVKAAYFKTDTIIRFLKSDKTLETIKLKPDDYAMMIHYFSSSKIDDWQKRRRQLGEMIADNAKIYQVDYTEQRGIEIYNKLEFIDKLTMPINSLKNIKIIETQYVEDKIFEMRFVQENNNEIRD